MKLLLKLMLLIYPIFIFASEVGYEVEVIIFEDLSNQYTNSEEWPITVNNNLIVNQSNHAPVTNDSIQAEYPDPNYENLSIEKSRLNEQLEKLKNNNNYNVLAHKIWKQTGLEAERAFPIHINSKDASSNITSPTQSLKDSATPVKMASTLTGTTTLIMSRYLHIKADLLYQRPIQLSTDEGSGNIFLDNPYKSYPVSFERRMRSKEIHYIDHPFIGMIILAVPFKLEPVPANADTTQKESNQ